MWPNYHINTYQTPFSFASEEDMAMKIKTLVLYPIPTIGHLVPMVELGKLIVTHHPTISVTILIITPPYKDDSTTSYINHVSQTTPLLHFHRLPAISLPADSSPDHQSLDLLPLYNPLLLEALQVISHTSTIKALIIDFFCNLVLDAIAKDIINIPTYYLYTSGVDTLAVFLNFPTIHNTSTTNLKDAINTHLLVPGVPPILVSDMPEALLDREHKAYEVFLKLTINFSNAKGIIVNSFEALEAGALKAIAEGLCVPDAPTPPVYCIGPLAAGRSGNKVVVGDECLRWLDSQPNCSVVFLCFGSLGLFSEAQLKEVAIGLEKSNQRFLWVVRSPPSTGDLAPPPEPDLEALLPQGFLERTKGRGLVVKSWAPQVEVLSHESVGGFVTHCGWNSVLEAVCAGVPMIAWPLYAEQKLNRVFLVKQMKVALPIAESIDGFVIAGEVEKRVGQLMESVEGRAIREEIKRMMEAAKVALTEGGSSIAYLSELVDVICV